MNTPKEPLPFLGSDLLEDCRRRLNEARDAHEKSNNALLAMMRKHDDYTEKLRIAYRDYEAAEPSNDKLNDSRPLRLYEIKQPASRRRM